MIIPLDLLTGSELNRWWSYQKRSKSWQLFLLIHRMTFSAHPNQGPPWVPTVGAFVVGVGAATPTPGLSTPTTPHPLWPPTALLLMSPRLHLAAREVPATTWRAPKLTIWDSITSPTRSRAKRNEKRLLPTLDWRPRLSLWVAASVQLLCRVELCRVEKIAKISRIELWFEFV